MTGIATTDLASEPLPTADIQYRRGEIGLEPATRTGIRFVDGCPPGLRFGQSLVIRIPSKPSRVPSYDECLAALPKEHHEIRAIKHPRLVSPHRVNGEVIYILDLYTQDPSAS